MDGDRNGRVPVLTKLSECDRLMMNPVIITRFVPVLVSIHLGCSSRTIRSSQLTR